MISEEKLKEFKKICKKRFGEHLSDQDVLEKATKLSWHFGKKVAKVIWLAEDKHFSKRMPKISYKRN